MKKIKKNSNGISHLLLPLIIIVVLIVGATFYMVATRQNTSKADSAAISQSKAVSCIITNVVPNPKVGSVQRPIVTVTNKSGKTIKTGVMPYLRVNEKTIDYPAINIGVIRNNSMKSARLPSYTVQYSENGADSYYGADYGEPTGLLSFKCSRKFTLPAKPIPPVTVYRYYHAPMDQYILSTESSLDPADYKGFIKQPGKEFKAFDKNAPGTKAVHSLLYEGGVTNKYTLDDSEIADCNNNKRCRDAGISFYAYPVSGTERVPVYVANKTYSEPTGSVFYAIYTTDENEAKYYVNTYGYQLSTAFWAQK